MGKCHYTTDKHGEATRLNDFPKPHEWVGLVNDMNIIRCITRAMRP